MNILISGGTGFIGSALTRALLADGHSIWILTRNPTRSSLPSGVQALGWDAHKSPAWLEVFGGMDVVVNLAGETVGRWPWNQARMANIHDSRVQAGQVISEAFQRSARKPAILIQASGIGYYGPLGTQPVTEASPAGHDFMAKVASDWEASSSSVDSMAGVRRVIIRTSLVLDPNEGVLPLMAMPVRLFAGGPLGNGQQGVSWIHIEDEVRAIRFLIENERAQGAFNLSAPQPVSSAAFIRSLAKELGRPYWMPAPALALKLLLGKMSTLLLDGQYAIPQKLLDLGFIFKYERPEDAFRALYSA
ncbi:MAG: TIGR01777 family oxidoreductase [Chloroflexi bacterium]|nr:TIGR01777 family oxidoreductase [Chloroflexota bacterium]